ncbi:hypothetical protein BJX76DRAFT_354010 [Aspergillus varians]
MPPMHLTPWNEEESRRLWHMKNENADLSWDEFHELKLFPGRTPQAVRVHYSRIKHGRCKQRSLYLDSTVPAKRAASSTGRRLAGRLPKYPILGRKGDDDQDNANDNNEDEDSSCRTAGTGEMDRTAKTEAGCQPPVQAHTALLLPLGQPQGTVSLITESETQPQPQPRQTGSVQPVHQAPASALRPAFAQQIVNSAPCCATKSDKLEPQPHPRAIPGTTAPLTGTPTIAAQIPTPDMPTRPPTLNDHPAPGITQALILPASTSHPAAVNGDGNGNGNNNGAFPLPPMTDHLTRVLELGCSGAKCAAARGQETVAETERVRDRHTDGDSSAGQTMGIPTPAPAKAGSEEENHLDAASKHLLLFTKELTDRHAVELQRLNEELVAERIRNKAQFQAWSDEKEVLMKEVEELKRDKVKMQEDVHRITGVWKAIEEFENLKVLEVFAPRAKQ